MVAACRKLDNKWNINDFAGFIRAYLGIRRNSYSVNPGLYSIGNPDKKSPVLVTANYKLSLDILRKNTAGLDSWIMVLDTKGINVWCAAGKGTFGTEEIIERINQVNLPEIVSHRHIIVPQLGAPGINPAEVKKKSSFSVIYGPVESRDILKFIDNNYQADKNMRIKKFPVKERIAVSVTHLSQGFIYTLLISLLFIISDRIFIPGQKLGILKSVSINTSISLAALFTSTILTGILLPVLPGRSFSIKGLSIGILFTAVLYYLFTINSLVFSIFYLCGKFMILLSWIVFTVINLTGSSTYTSLSGVIKEMTYSIPAVIASAAAGTILLIAGGLLI